MTLAEQVKNLAAHLNITPDKLIEMAVEQFIRHYSESQRIIHQGEVYWLPVSFDSDMRHPHVVIQDDVLNHSRINSVVVCALTSNVQRISMPGNVLLEAGEANLPKPSVVEVSKISTVVKTQLGDYIGTLSEQRVQQILNGIRFLQNVNRP